VNRSAGNPLPDEPWPLSARNLLSKREQSLYRRLVDLYPDHKILVQVALSQLINVDRNHPESESIRARYKQLVADFVLCRPDLSVVTVIELDDRTHVWPKRKAADARKNKALADAGIRLVRIPAGRLPTMEKVRELLDAHRPLDDRTDIPTLHAPEPELMLLEEVDDPSLAVPMDRTESESQVLKQITLKIILSGVLIVAGWFVYSQFLGFANQPAFQLKTVRSNASSMAHTVPLITPTAAHVTAAVAVQSSVNELAIQKQQALQAANALQRNKDQAWAAFYSAPASCEHPVDWTAQVECGNLYMRSKKRFEEQWATSQGTGAEVVLGNGSVEDPLK
jgi:hypothetical protein